MLQWRDAWLRACAGPDATVPRNLYVYLGAAPVKHAIV